MAKKKAASAADPNDPHGVKTFVTVKFPGEKPRKVRLGRKPPRPGQKALRLSYFMADGTGEALQPPASVDLYSKAKLSLDRMYKNDALGDCVIAEKYHKCGVNSVADGGECRVGDDSEVVSQYHRICGAGDNGCNIQDVLDDIVAGRFKVGGQPFNLDGYALVDNTQILLKVAIYLFGQVTLGLDLPAAWTSGKIWDVTNTRIVGGHDVGACGYDDQYVYISTWGGVVKMTWAAFTNSKWVGEAYACLGPDWYGKDKVNPSGVMVDELVKDLALIKQGKIPEIPPAALHTWGQLA